MARRLPFPHPETPEWARARGLEAFNTSEELRDRMVVMCSTALYARDIGRLGPKTAERIIPLVEGYLLHGQFVREHSPQIFDELKGVDLETVPVIETSEASLVNFRLFFPIYDWWTHPCVTSFENPIFAWMYDPMSQEEVWSMKKRVAFSRRDLGRFFDRPEIIRGVKTS